MTDTAAGRPASFTVGEEVLHDGRRWVVASIVVGAPTRYRLLATTPEGARIAWVGLEKIEKMARYTRPNDDTDQI